MKTKLTVPAFAEEIRPFGDRVFVLPDAGDERLGSTLPEEKLAIVTFEGESKPKPPQTGLVIAVGPGKVVPGVFDNEGRPVREPMDAQIGQHIVYSMYARTEVVWTDDATGEQTDLVVVRMSEVDAGLRS